MSTPAMPPLIDIGDYLRKKQIGAALALGAQQAPPTPPPADVHPAAMPVGAAPPVIQTPEADKYSQMVGQAPQLSDYQPTKGRKALGVLAGIGEGILKKDVNKGMETAHNVEYAPFTQKSREFGQKLEEQQSRVELEKGKQKSLQGAEESKAKVGHENLQGEAEVARKKAEEARAEAQGSLKKKTDFESSPEGRAFELEKTRAAHPGTGAAKDAGPWDLKLKDGTQIKGAVWTENGYKNGNTLIKQEAIEKAEKSGTQPKPENEFPSWADAFQKSHGRAPNDAEINAFHRPPRDTSGVDSRAKDARVDRNATIYIRNHQKTANEATLQLDKIDEADKMLNPSNAEASALAIPKVLTAVVSGQGTGVRITKFEGDSIAKARGIKGDIESWIRSMEGLSKLTPEQITQLKGVLSDVKGIVTKKQKIASQAMDDIQDAQISGDLEGVMKADKKARHALDGGTDKMSNSEYLKQLSDEIKGGK